MSPLPINTPQDARFLAQERIVDALLRALAIEQPRLLEAIREILIDTEFSHSGKPDDDSTTHQQIKGRLDDAANFAQAHGSSQS